MSASGQKQTPAAVAGPVAGESLIGVGLALTRMAG